MSQEQTRPLVQSVFVDAGTDFGSLDELLGYRLRRAQGAMHRDYMRAVEGLELTQKQTATLWLIDSNPGISQVAVAAALGMDRATMMALVDRLEDRKLITRKRSKVDRRRQELVATLPGQAILAKVKSRIAKHERNVRKLFSEQELAMLLDLLQRMQQLD